MEAQPDPHRVRIRRLPVRPSPGEPGGRRDLAGSTVRWTEQGHQVRHRTAIAVARGLELDTCAGLRLVDEEVVA